MVKVFKMQQMDDGAILRLEKLRGGAQERLVHEREGQVPLILEDQRRRKRQLAQQQQEPNINIAAPHPTPYKDVLVGQS